MLPAPRSPGAEPPRPQPGDTGHGTRDTGTWDTGGPLTKSLLRLYMLSSRWQRPSLGVRMAPSFPSPAKWKPSSVANTNSRVTLRQPISSWEDGRVTGLSFPSRQRVGGQPRGRCRACAPLLALLGSRRTPRQDPSWDRPRDSGPPARSGLQQRGPLKKRPRTRPGGGAEGKRTPSVGG